MSTNQQNLGSPTEVQSKPPKESKFEERCWANLLGNCSGGISGEHIVSETLYKEKQISVSGAAWLLGATKILPIQNLTANILCRNHNSALSPLDSANKDFWLVVGEYRKLSKALGQIRGPIINGHVLSVDATKVELWCLKTLTNCVAADWTKGITGWKPSRELVEIIFGNRPLPDGCGLGLTVREGSQINIRDQVQIAPILKDGELIGGLLTNKGLTFLCSWNVPLSSFPPDIFPDIPTGSSLYHIRKISHTQCKTTLRFDWSGKFDNSRDPTIRRLRHREDLLFQR